MSISPPSPSSHREGALQPSPAHAAQPESCDAGRVSVQPAVCSANPGGSLNTLIKSSDRCVRHVHTQHDRTHAEEETHTFVFVTPVFLFSLIMVVINHVVLG